MIVCPLMVAGEVIGTLNVARMGTEEAHFSRDEFELAQLFAAQASIALRNAEAHGAVVTLADHDALTGLRNHGAFQRELGALIERGAAFALVMLDLDAFKAYNDTHGHPAGDALLVRIANAMREAIREGDRALPLRRRRVLDPAARDRRRRRPRGRRAGPERGRAADRRRRADRHGQRRHLAPSGRRDRQGCRRRPPPTAPSTSRSRPTGSGSPTTTRPATSISPRSTRRRSGCSSASSPASCCARSSARAAGLVGVKHGFLYLLEGPDAADGAPDLVARVGTGQFEELIGYRIPRGSGVSWEVVRTGRPVVVDDYAEYAGRLPLLNAEAFGAVCAVPLTSGDEVLGVIGLASGDASRPFSVREVEALARFGQLASVALDNARLFERAQTEVRRRAHAALHDHLTGLPNRTMLLNRLAEQIEASAREQAGRRGAGRRVALILLDLDRFKVVNESLGHAAGDMLLAQVAQRLLGAARTTDTVARLGSDEFGILLGPVRSLREAERVAARIEAAIGVPFDLDGVELSVGASLGIAAASGAAHQPLDLLKQAEIALHRAKADPIRKTILFDPEMHAQTLDRATMEHDLRRALERSELRLHYQPLVELGTGTVIGVEALLRWEHPTRGLVPPLAFIPLAEETGLILPIGRWVLDTACHTVREWQRRFPAASRLAVSVNLSARQFAESGLIGDVATILDHTGLHPSLLELEITESVVMDQSEASVERLRGLRALGVKLVLDDFGTGYSSLSYLRRLPLDTIKVDRSFVMGLGSDPADLPIIQAVVSLAHGLGIDVVAEGIETFEQLASLRELDCDRGQGYWFSRPLPELAVEALLAGTAEQRVVLGAA